MTGRQFKAVLFLIMLCLATFWRVSQCDFISYDDPDYVTRNPHVLAGLNPQSIAWAFGNAHGTATYWHPVTWLSHMFDVQLFGVRPGPHHLVNLLFHTINVVLLFLVFQRMTGAFWHSLVLASLWAVHPLQVDTVAWVTERKNVLSGLFWFLTMGAYVRYAAKPSGSRYALVFLVMAVGLMCKPTLVTLPCVLLLLDFWPLRRLKWSSFIVASATNEDEPPPVTIPVVPVRRILLEKLPLFTLSLASGVLTIFAHQRLQVVALDSTLSFQDRFWNAFVSYARYLDKTIWPAKLAVFYPHPGAWPVWQVAASVLLLVLVTAVALLLLRRAPYLLVGWLWFLGVMVPTIGLLQAGSQAMADRFAYLPLIGVFLMLTWGGFDLLERLRVPSPNRLAPWFAVVVIFALVASLQVRHWKNNQTLFAQAMRVTDRNHLAEATVGNDLMEAGQYEEAREHLVRALQINPGYQVTYTLLGNLYTKLGRFEEAEPMFKQAIEISPNYVEGHVAYANALVQQQRLDDAARLFQKALQVDPNFAEAHNGLATVLVRQGKAAEGLAAYEQAIRLRPGFVEAMENRGVTFYNLGRLDEAAVAFQDALRLKPDSKTALLHFGNTRLAQRQFADALALFQHLLQLDPNSLDALNRVAWMLATQDDARLRNGPEAVRLAKRAGELTGNKNPASLNVLAAAYAEVGQFDQAVAQAGQAEQLARASGQTGLADIIQKLLELYRQGRPYRETAQ